MIMPDLPPTESSDHEGPDEAAHARAFLALIDAAAKQKKAPSVIKRKESEAHYSDALDAQTDETALQLLMLAALTDPGNAAALLELKSFYDLTLEEDLAATRAIIGIAERRLGQKAFKAYAGHFWRFLETRPYMQARAELASLLDEAGQTELAINEWDALIDLDPDDNQGLRFVMLPLCLRLGLTDKAGHLLAQFAEADGGSTLYAWCQLLERLLVGDDAGAAAVLASARQANGFVEAYLLGHRQPPRDPSSEFDAGTREEAGYFAHILLEAWDPHAGALKWLFAQPKPAR